jgi:mono/diheme cytochrome c family protein
MRSWHIFAIAALLIAGVAVGGWLLSGKQGPETGITQTAKAGGLKVTLRIDEQAIGQRVLDIAVIDTSGQPADVGDLRLRFSMLDMDMGMSEVVAQPTGKGRFQARGQFFSMAGNWRVDTVIVQVGQNEVQVPFTLAIAAPGEASGPSNPLPNDAATILAGQKLYLANCTPCHGASGRGDGPAGASLNPRPGDFTQHMVPGKHTDGQAFLWIKNGFPNSAMPAWGERFTDEQIWQLVRYIRTFGQATPALQPTGQAQTAGGSVPTVQEPLPPVIFARRGNVWRSAGDGSAPTQLTQLPEGTYAEYPTFSPDGQRIAFVGISAPPSDSTTMLPSSVFYVMNADGSALKPLWQPKEGLLSLFTWAVDGQSVLIAANGIPLGLGDTPADRQLTVARLDLASGKATPVVRDALDPTLSRDGAQLAFLKLSPDGYTMTLNVAAPDGSSPRELIGGKEFQGFYAPRFTPDGTKIVVAAIGGPETDAQGKPKAAVAPSLLERAASLFAPASAEAHGLPWDLWEVNADGTGLRRVTSFYEDLPMVAFAPDGKEAAVMALGGIYRMNADGSNLRRIDQTGDHGGLDWAR